MGGNNDLFENFERNKYLKKLPSMQRVKHNDKTYLCVKENEIGKCWKLLVFSIKLCRAQTINLKTMKTERGGITPPSLMSPATYIRKYALFKLLPKQFKLRSDAE